VVPESALGDFPVRRYHIRGIPVSAFPGRDERGDDLVVRFMRKCICEELRAVVEWLGPEVAHVMALARVVPGLELYDIWLQGEGLVEAVFEVVFAAAVPVLSFCEVFGLDG
jgi:hypothetical protein